MAGVTVPVTVVAKDKTHGVLNKVKTNANQIDNALKKSSSSASKLSIALKKALSPAGSLTKELKNGSSVLSEMERKLRGIVSAYGGVMTFRAIVEASDTITSAENRLNYFNGGDTSATEEEMDKMFAASLRSRADYGEMMANVGKSMTLAGDKAFGGQIDNAIRFQEIMSKAYAISGASAAEQSSSMYQMIQGLSAGVLQGDELRSVREGATMAYTEIEKFAQKTLNTTESLKDLASQGKITSDIVVQAMLEAGDKIDEAFENTDMTIAKAFTNMKSVALNALRPIQDTINEFINSDVGRQALEGIYTAIIAVAKALNYVVTLMINGATWLVNNWSKVSKSLYSVATALAVILAILVVVKVVSFLISNWWILLIAIIVGLIFYLSDSVEQALGIICGIIYAAIAWIVNIVYMIIAAIWNSIVAITVFVIQRVIYTVSAIILWIMAIWQYILWVITTIIAYGVTFANFWYTIGKGLYGAIKGYIVGVYQLFVWLANGVLGVLKSIASAIDFIFGSNLASTIGGWMDGLDSSVDSLNEKLDPKGEFEDIGERWSSSYSDLGDRYAGRGKYDNWNITDDMYNFGSGAIDRMNSIKEIGDSIKLDEGALLDWAVGSWDAGYNFGNNLGSGIENGLASISSGLIDMNDPAYSLNVDPNAVGGDVGKNIRDIAGNTGKMADSMELAEEDLEYLRKIANMEWKKEFTTASIKVDMSNYNNISGESDLDGIVTKLSDKLYEELDSVANGVYA